MIIESVSLQTISDSRGKPTVEAIMKTKTAIASASVPAGKSTGVHEMAVHDPTRVGEVIDQIQKDIIIHSCTTQQAFDHMLIRLDGTPNRGWLGANIMLALSMAWARLKAHEDGRELYVHVRALFKELYPQVRTRSTHPIFNVINGGAHATVPDAWHDEGIETSGLDFQEFQVIPHVDDFALALSLGQEFYIKLKNELEKRYGAAHVAMGDEAGFFAPFASNEEALDILATLIERHRYPMRIGIDAAASQLYAHGSYRIGTTYVPAHDMVAYYQKLIASYNLISIEDPFDEEAFATFSDLLRMQKNGPVTPLIITDDLTTTNVERLDRAIRERSGNAILLKPNQIGTLTETLQAAALAYQHGWEAIVSHRSGETMDSYIADIATGIGAWGLKAGSPARPERMAKYQRMAVIGAQLHTHPLV